jgi:tetratricopeptide (TPR) repeat protein
MQRSARVFVIGFVLNATLLVAAGIGCSRTTPAEEPKAAPPRTLMRIPLWIETFGDRSTPRPDRPAPAAAPIAPQSPAGVAVVAPVAEGTATGQPQPIELAIASTPAASAEGKPGRALVRSRDTSSLDPHALLTSGWTDLAPGESAGPKPEDSLDTTLQKPRRELGPEASVLTSDAEATVAEDVAPDADAAPVPESSAPMPLATTDIPAAPAVEADEEPIGPDTATVTDAATDTVDPGPVAPAASAESDQAPTLAIDPASFRGVFPGKTTRDEVETAWGKGEAFTRDDGTSGLSWKVEPFERVEVILDGESVGSILIKLAEPTAVADLAKQLEINDIRTVSVLDEQGISIGEVYPERGVILSLQPGTQAAQAVILEPLDPEAFVLRAEGELAANTALATADLQYAVEIDPNHLRALRLLLALRCEQGKWADALRLARQAEQADAADIWTRLKHAGVLVALEQTDAAREKVAAVRQQSNTSPLVVAQAERMLGRIEMASPQPDYEKAVEHFGTAIRTAGPLAEGKSESIRKAAQDVILDAHLGTALAIAKGTWQQKSRVIPKWISRSETIVGQFDASGEEKHLLELQLCRGVLSVAAGSTESGDPLPWVKRLLQVRASLDSTTADPWRRRQIDWEIGQGLSDALVAAQKRGDSDDILENSTLTAAYLERGSEMRQLTAAERKKVGNLMFQIGVLHGLQKGEHATAVTWFDRVLPLWEGNATFARDGELGQLGESYVSIAISYWQAGRRDDAVAICRRGIDIMVEAVGQRQLPEQSLAVAYGNLSTMYAEQGDDDASRSYADLASRAEASGTVRK